MPFSTWYKCWPPYEAELVLATIWQSLRTSRLWNDSTHSIATIGIQLNIGIDLDRLMVSAVWTQLFADGSNFSAETRNYVNYKNAQKIVPKIPLGWAHSPTINRWSNDLMIWQKTRQHTVYKYVHAVYERTAVHRSRRRSVRGLTHYI